MDENYMKKIHSILCVVNVILSLTKTFETENYDFLTLANSKEI